ncbi:GNAT family N-acetyltransferase [Aquimarina sp. ERC-38]|uniref:GNAT family N-acetyltransferase n=1 Tax=Aquimarina sp. ERC-38 TaxID=2949996 RepID=UPI0022474C4B|nr:GNAT family N-acetyltransferase [Aquimarina sp. ERC-38]UZO79230.1 GNAT family N-acetyltransferase [Aquimarina sp. ERC-38]
MNYQITKSTQSDLGQLQQFFYDVVTNFKSQRIMSLDTQKYMRLVADRNFWNDKFKNAFVYTVKLNSEILGVAMLLKDGTIPVLLVHHNYRRKGIATRLYHTLEAVALHNHILVLKIAIEEKRTVFFKKVGFEIATTVQKAVGSEDFKELVAIKYLKYYSKN